MNRLASTLAFAGAVTAASLAAVLMSSTALAETPTIDTTKFTSTLSRAQVRTDLLSARNSVSANASEWAMQSNWQKPIVRSQRVLSRADVKAEYIASRDETRAINSEDGGSSYIAQARTFRTPNTMVAGSTTP
ncbi:MAG: hypothetical protein V4787_04960 [Pseudomonadota bacterium]